MNYALVVKTSNENWEVIGKYNIIQESKLEMLSNAHNNKTPIIGMVTSSYTDSVAPFATWNGSSFSGGIKPEWHNDPDLDWSVITSYSILVDNVVVLVLNNVKNDPSDDKLQAAFESEVTLVPINIDNIPRIGWIWNGEQFLKEI